MRRVIVGIVWAIGIYIAGCIIVDTVTSTAAETSRPIISLVAASIGALGSWKGFLPGSLPRNRRQNESTTGRQE